MYRRFALVGWIIVVALLLSVNGVTARSAAPAPMSIGTAFTYQGRLINAAGPVNDHCDFQFSLWDSLSNSSGQVGAPQSLPNVVVINGLFTVQLDFGANAFPGDARWLQIAVRCPASAGVYTSLQPRQPITPAPYALFSSSTGALQNRSVATTAPGLNQVLRWNGSAWSPAADITAVYAGAGLSGGGTSGDVTLSANFASNGISTTVARGDHNHWGQTWQGTEFGLTLVATQTTYVNSTALHAIASGNGNGTGVQGVVSLPGSDAGMLVPTGVSGISLAPAGGWGNKTFGVFGEAQGNGGFGVIGYGTYTGTAGFADASAANGIGVYGEALGSNGTGVYGNGSNGVWATSPVTNGNGVVGIANTGPFAYGVWGQSSSGYAGYFSGNVYVSGNLTASGAKPFKIDNPLDPKNQYLYHYAVESPQVENVYNGTILLDANGEAMVQLPTYFSAINTGDYRYYLTAIGAPMPNLYIAAEIQGNTFKIAGGAAGKKVSWMVYGQRNDPWMRDHPQPDVVAKPEGEAGTYLYPQGYGQPDSLSSDFVRMQQLQGQSAITSTSALYTPAHSPWIQVQPSPARK